jgi:ubiquinone/menaquinone biosynthesis C-methylase UbiE
VSATLRHAPLLPAMVRWQQAVEAGHRPQAIGLAAWAPVPDGGRSGECVKEAAMAWRRWFRRSQRDQQVAGDRRERRDYIFGESEHEISRLDMQHYMFRWEFGGDYLAPVRPTAILDVACGTGRWALDMARRFPRAAVVAFDINRDLIERVLSDPELPGNCTFVVADALKPFEFTDGNFDFVMARANSSYIPIPQWPSVVAEMARVTGSGGWVELRDFGLVRSESPALTSLTDLFARMAAMRPIYPGAGAQLADFLRAAGLREVKARTVTVRVGRRTTRGGRLMLTDYLSLLERVTPLIAQMGLASQAQWETWLVQARQETNTGTTRVDLTAAYGRR